MVGKSTVQSAVETVCEIEGVGTYQSQPPKCKLNQRVEPQGSRGRLGDASQKITPTGESEEEDR